jgi:small subunit ribosomal protein S17
VTDSGTQAADVPVGEGLQPADLELAPGQEEAQPGAAASARQRAERKVRQGVVISSRMQKTVVVRIERSVRHPLYGRTFTKSSKLKAHDERNECNPGDRVEVHETRPLSRDKRWRVARILERAR